MSLVERGARTKTSDESIRRTPPQNLEAEQSVLGAILICKPEDKQFGQGWVMDQLADVLSVDDFYRETHRRIYGVMLDLHARGIAIDAVTLSDGLRARELLDPGIFSYIAELAATVPTAVNVGHYAQIVVQKAALRRLASTATQIASEAYDSPTGEDLAKLLVEAEYRVRAAACASRLRPPLEPLDDVANRIVEEARTNPKRNTVPTGFASLDRALKGGGFGRGTLVTIAGATSVGKSAFALNLITHVSRGGVLYCSVEMPREDLIERALSDFAGVDFGEVAQRHEAATDPTMRIVGFLDTELERLARARERLFLMNLEIIYQPDLTVADVASRARACANKWDGKLDLVVVDYLQIMTPTEREDKRHVELSVMTKALKRMAGELNVPVVLLSQLTREAGKRGGCPMLQELREAGSIENDSDVVMFLWEDKPKSGVAAALSRGVNVNLSIAKQRQGPLHTVSLTFEREFFRFTEN